MAWEIPHRRGGRQQAARPRQRLRPNAFAQLARVCATNGTLVVLLFLALATALGGYAGSVLSIDPDQRPRITLDGNTARLQAALDREFPGIEQTFLAFVDGQNPQTARAQALALAASLAAQEPVFLSAFVPGTGAFYDTNAMLFRTLPEVRQRVDSLIQMEPLHYAMASAPDIVGFASLVSQIGKAVEQGRSPPGLEAMLQAASAAIEGEVKGQPRPVQWAALAGLEDAAPGNRWFVLATPRPGMEPRAAAAARKASQGMEGVTWLWPRRALASTPSTARDFIVPASLSVLLVMLLATALLGSLRQTLALMLGVIATLSAVAAAAAVMGRPLDGASWPFALAVMAPVFVAGSMLVTAFANCRSMGLSVIQSVMMSSHQQGGLATASILMFAGLWAAWVPRMLPSLSAFAEIALIGCAVAWLVTLTLLPAALAMLAKPGAAEEPNWLDEAMGGGSRHGRNAMDAIAMIVLAGAIFCAAFLPAVRFGERQVPSSPPPQIETPDARGAVHILVPPEQVGELQTRLSALPEVGSVRTVAQFLPPEASEKVAELRRLSALTPLDPAFRPPADSAQLSGSFAELEEQLTAIAGGSATSPGLKEAALGLRRSVMLFMSSAGLTETGLVALERALFGGLGALSARMAQLAGLEVPSVASLDPRLLRRFVSEQGTWRIEVMPRNGTDELGFAAALRRAVPEAAGEPLVSLARNEIIHHETVLALATGLVVAVFLLLGALRNVTAWILALVPAGAFITLAAAVTVTFGIGLNASMLAGLSAALAVVITSSMRLSAQLSTATREPEGFGVALRAALLPPLALALAAGPLALSSRPSVAETGAGLGLLLVIAALLIGTLVPAMARWIVSLMPRKAKRRYRRR